MIEADSVTVAFDSRRGAAGETVAVADVSMRLAQGDRIGLVGESGCGKSTLVRSLFGLTSPRAGVIRYKGKALEALAVPERNEYRRNCQLVFQDPSASFDPRVSILRSVLEPLEIQGIGDRADRRVTTLQALATVGINEATASRRPGSLSGGQLQRAAIARALILDPRILVLDEAVSALDVSVQAQILQMLLEIHAKRSIGYLFVSHDLAVVESVTDYVFVMFRGRFVEAGPTSAALNRPLHPYTSQLANAAPRLWRDPGTASLADRTKPPDLSRELKVGQAHCPYVWSCSRAVEPCRDTLPLLELEASGHNAACFNPRNHQEGTQWERKS